VEVEKATLRTTPDGQPSKLAEALVERQQNPPPVFGHCEDINFAGAGRYSAHPNNIMSGAPQRRHRVPREILVGE
jgi:hypothetical protein